MAASSPAPIAELQPRARCHVIRHKGVDIVVIDLAHTSPEEAIPIMAAAGVLIARYPLKSVRAFTDGRGAVYSKQSFAALKDFTIKNTPHILASAVIGTDGLRAAAFRAVALVTGRNIRPFTERLAALDWLADVPDHPPSNAT